MKPSTMGLWILALVGCYLLAWVGLIWSWLASAPFDLGLRFFLTGLLTVLTVALEFVFSFVPQVLRTALWGVVALGWFGTTTMIVRLSLAVEDAERPPDSAMAFLFFLLALLGVTTWALLRLLPRDRRR
jgi:hypothetical protein